jgi:uncharacterized protein (DUF4415 family)
MDKETEKFAADVLESIRQMKRGEVAQAHTPEEITARRGRPVGSMAAVTKLPVKLRLDPDVLAALRATGRGWQTRVNALLREAVGSGRLGA